MFKLRLFKFSFLLTYAYLLYRIVLATLVVAVDVRGAGEGTLEIGISGPSGQNIPNNVLSLGQSQFEVTFVPCESGQHRANITFNKENVNGSYNTLFF